MLYTLVVEVSDAVSQDDLIANLEVEVDQVVFCGPGSLVEVPEQDEARAGKR